MSLVKSIARLQRICLHLVGTVTGKQGGLSSRMGFIQEVLIVAWQVEKGIQFGVNQNWKCTYLIQDYTSICLNLYNSILTCFNHSSLRANRCKCHPRKTIQLKRLKVLPKFRAADLLAWSAVRLISINLYLRKIKSIITNTI